MSLHGLMGMMLVTTLALGAITSCGGAAVRPPLPQSTEAALKTFTEAYAYIDGNYVDAIEPQALITRAIHGMAQVIDASGALVAPDFVGTLDVVPSKHRSAALKVFTEAYTYIDTHYPATATAQALIDGAIRGMVRALDPRSSYIPPEVYREMQVETEGRFPRVGLDLTMRDDIPTVVVPVEGGPAFRAGIQPGDQLVKVDGTSTKEMTLIETIKKLRGPEGTPVTLTVFRQGFPAPQDFLLSRTVVPIITVRWTKLQDDIGYVKLHHFRKSTEEELEEALQDLGQQHIKSLVLDLRNNPGGLLEQAIAVSNVFLEGGKLIVSTKGRLPSQNMKGFSKSEGFHVSYAMVVIVNGGSAAASEIVAGALQDVQRALILGTSTVGNGSIQTSIPLSNGSTLNLTTAYCFTPGGHPIQGKGITPDIVVEQPPSERLRWDSGRPLGDLTTDVQLQRAVEHLRATRSQS